MCWPHLYSQVEEGPPSVADLGGVRGWGGGGGGGGGANAPPLAVSNVFL